MATHRPTWRLEVKTRPEGSTGFTPLRQRWVVERTNAWKVGIVGTVNDYERKPTSSAVMIQMSNESYAEQAHRVLVRFPISPSGLKASQRGGEFPDSL